MASTHLYRTESASNRRTWTWSGWIKRSKLDSTQIIMACSYDSSNRGYLYFSGGNVIGWGEDGGSVNIYTTRKFRDTSAWYHIVLANDTTQATASNRMKLYVNGEQVALDGGSQPSQNYQLFFNIAGGYIPYLGTRAGQSPDYFDGSMSHVAHIDGTQELPTIFGETDSTTGEWKIKTTITPSSGWGTNGYHILVDGNSGTDQSGQSNSWTVGSGTLTKTEDNPSNVFATLSPDILPRNSGGTISNGNLFFGTSAAQWTTESSAFGIANGKYYFEVKLKDNGGDRRFRWGLQKNAEITKTGNNKVIGGTDNNAIGYKTEGEGATQGGYFINQTGTTMSDGDINENNAIYGFAIDLDNQRMYGHFNGTWFHSGNPSAGSGGIDVSSFYTVGEPLFPSFTTHNSNIEINFGNGYFGTTAVASAGTNASGNGIFEYNVPTGYTALSTKGLNL